MAIRLSINYDLTTATFYREEEAVFIGKTIGRFFLKMNWTLFNQEDQKVASYDLKQGLIAINSKLVVDYEPNKSESPLTLTFKMWKAPHIKFEFAGDEFLIVFHIGTKFSFFKNGKQFAYLVKRKLSISVLKEYKLVADADIDLNLLAMMAYAILIITEDEFESSADINLDLGNLGPQLKAFDDRWSPNSLHNPE